MEAKFGNDGTGGLQRTPGKKLDDPHGESAKGALPAGKKTVDLATGNFSDKNWPGSGRGEK